MRDEAEGRVPHPGPGKSKVLSFTSAWALQISYDGRRYFLGKHIRHINRGESFGSCQVKFDRMLRLPM